VCVCVCACVCVCVRAQYCMGVACPTDANFLTREQRQLQEGTFSIFTVPLLRLGHAVAQWLRRYATNRKVAGSMPDEVNF
jgi:hypothetical protein